MESEGLAQTDGRGSRSQVVYDAQGRVAKTIDPLGHETTYAYDALGRQVAVIDPLGHTITTAYDAEDHILSQRGATYPVDYAYDVYGNKVAMTTYRNEELVDGDTTRWLYDEPSGCMTNKLYADGKGPSYSYTPDGKLARRIWARGIATDYTYDNAGQLILTTYSDTGHKRVRDKRYSLERYSQVASEGRRPDCLRAFMATSAGLLQICGFRNDIATMLQP